MNDVSVLNERYISRLNGYEKKIKNNNKDGSENYIKMASDQGDLRNLAAYEIRLMNDVDLFRSRIMASVNIQLSIFEAYDQGLSVHPGFVTMTSFYHGLDAMAAGNIELGRQFFEKIGGREKAERANDSKFISAIGYASKDLVLHGECSAGMLANLERQFSKKSVSGYPLLFEGISRRDKSLAVRGVEEILKGHKVLSRPGGIFAHTPDELVCFWALGLINYASFLGMSLNIPESELLPRSLLLQPPRA